MKTNIAMILLAVAAACAEDLTVFPPPQGTNAPSNTLDAWLKQQAFAACDARKAAYEKLKTPEDIAAWQKERREYFVRALGGFPERTPLNARVTGKFDGGDYRVEKVIYESEPHHHVTAALYLPKTKPPYPGVLVPCGHSVNGKAAKAYQQVCILLAKNGFATLCYDPIAQGERAQILKPDGKVAFNSTQEHTLTGIGAILIGRNAATYRIWDGMRSLDYLMSRREVDPKRIGCTGNSGGGTLTSYLMALDDRIGPAAPSCYPTTFRNMIEIAGAQDAEQNIFGQLAAGMEITDYVLMRAPKPTLINCATRDTTFTPAGTWDLFRESKRLYTRMGYASRVELTEADEPHGFSTHLRVGAVRWMRRWLLGKEDEITEPEFPVWKDEEIQCSPKGQVMLMDGERSTFDLNADAEAKLAVKRRQIWSDKTDALAKTRETVGVQRLKELPPLAQRYVGVVERQGYRIEKLALVPASGIELPALVFVPAKPATDAVLYLHGDGKQADAAVGGAIEKLVAQGRLVLAVDLPGLGETEGGGKRKWYGGTFGPNAGNFFHAYLLGKSLVSIWTENALACVRFAATYHADAPRKVHLVGVGQAGIAALHAAALEPDSFASLTLRRTLTSWADVVRTPTATNQLVTLVHGALRTYDLPDLVAAVGKDKVTIEEPLNAKGEPVR